MTSGRPYSSECSPFSALDGETPGGVYCCQVNLSVSCGACCGLYNVADASRETLSAHLNRRTDDFRNVERDPDAIEAFGRQVLERENNEPPPYPGFHHCPYIGLIREQGCERVGCLLHPLADGNSGVDWRGLSYYGGMACRSYFCLSTKELPTRWKRILRARVADWYDWGLLITDKEWISAVFTAVEQKSGMIDEDSFLSDPGHCLALEELIRLRINWPWRGNLPVAGYFFEDKKYQRPPLPSLYGGIIADQDTRNSIALILRETGSDFISKEACGAAADRIRDILNRLGR